MRASHKKALKAFLAVMQDSVEIVNEALEASQEVYDNLSERSQEGAKGEKLQEEISSLETIQNAIEEIIAELENLGLSD